MNTDIHSDRIDKLSGNGELVLPIGHFALVNGKFSYLNKSPIISIYGLGSCIALILYDEMNKIGGMSHVLLPGSRKKKEIKYPHKYADLSVKYLYHELLEGGAERKNIRAYIVGGSKIFDLDNNIIGDENIKSIKHELDELNITITNESLGGRRGRIIKFDTQDYTVLVRKSGEKEFQKL